MTGSRDNSVESVFSRAKSNVFDRRGMTKQAVPEVADSGQLMNEPVSVEVPLRTLRVWCVGQVNQIGSCFLIVDRYQCD